MEQRSAFLLTRRRRRLLAMFFELERRVRRDAVSSGRRNLPRYRSGLGMIIILRLGVRVADKLTHCFIRVLRMGLLHVLNKTHHVRELTGTGYETAFEAGQSFGSGGWTRG